GGPGGSGPCHGAPVRACPHRSPQFPQAMHRSGTGPMHPRTVADEVILGLMVRQRDIPTLSADVDAKERVVLVGVQLDGAADEEVSLEELEALVRSAGGEVVGTVVQRRNRPDPATFVGRGKLTEVSDQVRATDAQTVVFDEELSPAQLRNIEE